MSIALAVSFDMALNRRLFSSTLQCPLPLQSAQGLLSTRWITGSSCEKQANLQSTAASLQPGVVENWETESVSPEAALEFKKWAFRVHGSYYNLVDRLEKDRLQMFRKYQYLSSRKRRSLNHLFERRCSNNRYGYDGPHWKKFWIRRRRPNSMTY